MKERKVKTNFKANPIPDAPPFQPHRSDKPLTVISDFALNSDARSAQRQRFEQHKTEKAKAAEEARRLQEEAAKVCFFSFYLVYVPLTHLKHRERKRSSSSKWGRSWFTNLPPSCQAKLFKFNPLLNLSHIPVPLSYVHGKGLTLEEIFNRYIFCFFSLLFYLPSSPPVFCICSSILIPLSHYCGNHHHVGLLRLYVLWKCFVIGWYFASNCQ